MAIRTEIPERVPLEKVEIEYVRPPDARDEPVRPGFNRARLLDINSAGMEMAAREAFGQNEKVTCTLHVKGVRDFLKVEGEVKKIQRISVFKQPAYSVQLQFGKLTSAQSSKVAWAEEQLTAKARTPVQRPPEKKAAPSPTPAAAKAAPEPAKEVRRPVALLELIQCLDQLEVTDDLILATIEAAESGMDIEDLYEDEADSQVLDAHDDVAESSSESAMPAQGIVRPMHVYRLASNTQLYFSDQGLPMGPATEVIYLSRLKSPETCFAVELSVDTLSHEGTPRFKRGSLLIFSTTERVESGDIAFVKSRAGDEVGQVFLDKDEVRLRPLNPQYREHVMRRPEAKYVYKLIGHYEDIDA